MTAPLILLAAQSVGTAPLQSWIQNNIIPLILLAIAVILLWIGGRGDNAGVARRGAALVIGLLVLGIAVSGRADEVGVFLASLVVG